ncbi:MAG: MBL fold metallo-hydrolase [bacterium]|nr:MBL fold metallo-hydrolase [bacterium]
MRRSLAVVALALAAACTALPRARELGFHASDADAGLTRLVHGSFVVDLAGERLLVDPWFNSGLLTRQSEPLGLVPSQLPAVAAVLVTDDATEHLDASALGELAAKTPRAIVPASLARRLQRLGFREVTPLVAWESTTVGDVRVTGVPSGQGEAALGYVLEGAGASLYFVGDAPWFPALHEIAARFPRLSVAVLPIGGKRTVGLRRTMDPEQAADAAKLLAPQRIVPAQYGASSVPPLVLYADDPVGAFRQALRRDGIPPDRLLVLDPGESWHWLRPAATARRTPD